MKAVVCTKYGPPDVLQIEDVEKPVPKDNEVLIKIHASTVTIEEPRLRNYPADKHPVFLWLIGGLILGFRKPKKLSLEQIADAHTYVEKRHKKGNVVIKIGETK